MSHFTKLDKAQIVSVAAFIATCAEMGLTDIKENAKIKDYYGKEIDVDVAVKCGPRYDIALKGNEEGKFDMVADWWGCRGHLNTLGDSKYRFNSDGEFQDYLLRHTTKHTIIDKYRRDGFRAEVTEDEKQNLNIKLSRAE